MLKIVTTEPGPSETRQPPAAVASVTFPRPRAEYNDRQLTAHNSGARATTWARCPTVSPSRSQTQPTSVHRERGCLEMNSDDGPKGNGGSPRPQGVL